MKVSTFFSPARAAGNRGIRCAGLLVVSGLLLVVGCGKSSEFPLAPVSGTVTQNGNPLAGVNVMFMPESGKGAPSGGLTDASGKFSLQYNNGQSGAVLGQHRVVISVPGEEPPPPTGGEKPARAVKPAPEYFKTATVQDAQNDFTFEVTEK